MICWTDLFVYKSDRAASPPQPAELYNSLKLNKQTQSLSLSLMLKFKFSYLYLDRNLGVNLSINNINIIPRHGRELEEHLPNIL